MPLHLRSYLSLVVCESNSFEGPTDDRIPSNGALFVRSPGGAVRKLGGLICRFESARWKSEALAPYRGGVENDDASTVYCVGCRAGGDVAARSSASPLCLPSAL
eukprot:2302388-Pleurochrysis_carterae.AAC.1